MKGVTQKHNFGCGAACVAFISNEPYTGVVAALGKEKAETSGFFLVELSNYLSSLGLIYDHKYLNKKIKGSIYYDGVIVFIKRSKRYPDGHYLARKHGLWMDPWINFPSDINQAESGFRNKLPGKPIYVLFPT